MSRNGIILRFNAITITIIDKINNFVVCNQNVTITTGSNDNCSPKEILNYFILENLGLRSRYIYSVQIISLNSNIAGINIDAKLSIEACHHRTL